MKINNYTIKIMTTIDRTALEQRKQNHLKKAKEYQDYINGKPFIGDTEKTVYERLRDNRLKLATQIN